MKYRKQAENTFRLVFLKEFLNLGIDDCTSCRKPNGLLVTDRLRPFLMCHHRKQRCDRHKSKKKKKKKDFINIASFHNARDLQNSITPQVTTINNKKPLLIFQEKHLKTWTGNHLLFPVQECTIPFRFKYQDALKSLSGCVL